MANSHFTSVRISEETLKPETALSPKERAAILEISLYLENLEELGRAIEILKGGRHEK